METQCAKSNDEIQETVRTVWFWMLKRMVSFPCFFYTLNIKFLFFCLLFKCDKWIFYCSEFFILRSCMSVERDVKWCPVSRITNPLALKKPFHWISMKIRLERADRETSKSPSIKGRRCYMAETLPVRRKTLYNKSIFRSCIQNAFPKALTCVAYINSGF